MPMDFTKTTVAAVGVIGAISLLIFSGGAAGLVDSNELFNESVDVTNETDTVFVNVTNTTNGPVNVTFAGYNATTGNYTVESEQQANASNTTTKVDWLVDGTQFDSYQVVVHEDSSTATAQSVESVNFGSTMIGAGGGLFGTGIEGGSAAGILLIAAFVGLIVKRREA